MKLDLNERNSFLVPKEAVRNLSDTDFKVYCCLLMYAQEETQLQKESQSLAHRAVTK
jgi:hypothetical protein